MFSGSFRSNLDPFGQAGSDAAVWEALRQAGLDGMVRSMGVSGDIGKEGTVGVSTEQGGLLAQNRVICCKHARQGVLAAADTCGW